MASEKKQRKQPRKWTAGPWEWARTGFDGFRYYVLRRVESKGTRRPVVIDAADLPPKPADCALIAAAPDLYEALEALERMDSKVDPFNDPTSEAYALRMKARAALARARGES